MVFCYPRNASYYHYHHHPMIQFNPPTTGRSRVVRFDSRPPTVVVVAKLRREDIVGDCRSSSNPNWCAIGTARYLKQLAFIRRRLLFCYFRRWKRHSSQ